MTPVVTPLVVLLLLGAAFFAILQSRTKRAAIGLGSIYAAVVLVYGSYPLLMYLALDGYYTPFNDQRLISEQPLPADMGRIAWYYCAYLACFCTGYLLRQRKKISSEPLSIADLDSSSVWALFTVFILLRGTMICAELLFAEKASDYLEVYLKYKNLPLLAQQVLGHVEGITMILSITVMAFLCKRWDRYRMLVLAWIAFEMVLLFGGLGARTQFVMLCLSALFSYHFLYRPVSVGTLLTTGVALVIAFLGLGILRQLGTSGITAIGIEAVASSNEFEALFSNAYDVQRLITLGDIDRGSMVGTVYLGDVINLIPQQITPFEKLNLANWYVETFHSEFAERGGGLAFGAIPEALVGTGWPDLIWRAVLVGFVFCWFDQHVREGRVTLWKFTFFLWLMTSCYLTFRLTMLGLVPIFVYRFVPAMLVVSFLAYLLREAAVGPEEGDTQITAR